MVESILLEATMRKSYLQNKQVQSVYFGGGTPSLLETKELEKILQSIHKNFSLDAGAEITLEANPDDIRNEVLREWKDIGINRLSIGIQSFYDRDLLWMNRSHDADQAIKSIELALANGFENLTADLIYGIPMQSHSEWEQNILTLTDAGIHHLSCYALTVEPRTVLQHMVLTGKTMQPDEKHASEQFEILTALTKEKEFEQYEISNFARNKNYAVHNTSYWKGNTYLGLGPSAHSYNGSARQWNISNNSKYMRGIEQHLPVSEEELLTTHQQMNERIMLGLRTQWGMDIKQFIAEFGTVNWEIIRKEGSRHFASGTLFIDNDQLHIAQKNKFIADKVISDLFFTDQGRG